MSGPDRQRQDLIECATLARRIAPATCRVDPALGEACAWYHGFWPYLRLLEVVGSPYRHQGFFREALAPSIAGGNRGRVLVSGAVDYAMPALAIDIYREAGAALDLTVADICETPLALVRWYGARIGVSLATSAGDILDYAPGGVFDVILTHSFLAMFPPDRRRALLRRWRLLLRPGGVVVTISRLRPDSSEARIGFTPLEAENFIAAVGRAAQGGLLDLDAKALVAGARAYVERQRIWPVRTAAEIEALFQDSGFRLERLEENWTERAAAKGAASGPTAKGGAYAMIVAVRS